MKKLIEEYQKLINEDSLKQQINEFYKNAIPIRGSIPDKAFFCKLNDNSLISESELDACENKLINLIARHSELFIISFKDIKTEEFRDKLLAAALEFDMKVKGAPEKINVNAPYLKSLPNKVKIKLGIYNGDTLAYKVTADVWKGKYSFSSKYTLVNGTIAESGDFFVTFEIEYGTSKFEVEIGAINIPAAQTLRYSFLIIHY